MYDPLFVCFLITRELYSSAIIRPITNKFDKLEFYKYDKNLNQEFFFFKFNILLVLLIFEIEIPR